MTTNGLLTGFFVSLGAVVVCLVVAIAFAKRHDVKKHLWGVGAMLVALISTLGFAETLGRRYTFEDLPYRVHMPLAYLAALVLLAPLFTGFRHWQGKVSLTAHQRSVGVWLLTVVLALVTGIWMLATGTRIAE